MVAGNEELLDLLEQPWTKRFFAIPGTRAAAASEIGDSALMRATLFICMFLFHLWRVAVNHFI